MSFTGNENHDIDLQTAEEWTKNYRDAHSSTEVRAHYFGKTKLLDILGQTGCVGMRIYYALDENDAKQLILVGVNSAGEDLYNGVLAEKSLTCPTDCAASSPLNSL